MDVEREMGTGVGGPRGVQRGGAWWRDLDISGSDAFDRDTQLWEGSVSLWDSGDITAPAQPG